MLLKIIEVFDSPDIQQYFVCVKYHESLKCQILSLITSSWSLPLTWDTFACIRTFIFVAVCRLMTDPAIMF